MQATLCPFNNEGVNAEHLAVRENVGVFDVSHMGEVFVSGENALDFLQYITSNDVSKLIPGKSTNILVCQINSAAL